jgi:hypothetical protein
MLDLVFKKFKCYINFDNKLFSVHILIRVILRPLDVLQIYDFFCREPLSEMSLEKIEGKEVKARSSYNPWVQDRPARDLRSLLGTGKIRLPTLCLCMLRSCTLCPRKFHPLTIRPSMLFPHILMSLYVSSLKEPGCSKHAFRDCYIPYISSTKEKRDFQTFVP